MTGYTAEEMRRLLEFIKPHQLGDGSFALRIDTHDFLIPKKIIHTKQVLESWA